MIKFMLKVANEDTGQTKILPLPHNDNIFELLGNRCNDLYIVEKKAKLR